MDETPFHRALRWRVHDPAEALWIAATHRSQAADARAQSPATVAGFRDLSRQCLLEERAQHHDDIAAVCEQHAAALLHHRSDDVIAMMSPSLVVSDDTSLGLALACP